MKNITLHTINLNSWCKTRTAVKSLDGEFAPFTIKGEGHEFSFFMANHLDPAQIKEALLQIVHDLQENIPDFALEISKEKQIGQILVRWQLSNFRCCRSA